MRSAGVMTVVLGLCCGATGCTPTRGPLLRSVGADAAVVDRADGGADATADAGRSPITQQVRWQYQLVDDVDPALDAELFVIDLNVSDALLTELRARGRTIVAYISAGTLEPFRDDAERFPQAAIGRELQDYPEESWLDVRDAEVRALMAERLDLARDKGFDGVLPSNLTAYQADSGFALTAQDQLQYTRWLADQAHQRGLLVGMSGDFQQAASLVDAFDWALHEGCIERDDCEVLAPFAQRGKPVLDMELSGSVDSVCERAAALQVNAILKRPGFDAYRVQCP